MKIVVALCLVASASAFVPQSVALARAAARSVATEPEQGEPPAAAPGNSIAMPFMSRPALLDGTLAGDVGFDPLGFADNPQNLQFYAQAEIKHARLAMLCAAGWPLAERWHLGLASTLGLPDALADGGRAPSVLNGHLGASAGFLAAVFLGAAAAETFTVQRRWRRDDPDGYSPGELGFDPLGVYGDDPATRKARRSAELANGRLAMVAVLGYVLLEAGSHQPVASLTPALFAPPWETAAALFGGAAN